MRKIVLLMLGISFPLISGATQISEKEAVRRSEIFMPSCLQKQKRDPITKNNFSELQLEEYCGCVAKLLSESVTAEDMVYANKHRKLDHIKTNIDAAGQYCATILIKKEGQPYSGSDSEYVSRFRRNVSLICQRDMSSGSDGLPFSIAKPVCECYGDRLSKSLTVAEMKESDVIPSKYASHAERVMDQCVKKVISGK